MLVWLQHEKDCFDNPTTYLPYIWKVRLCLQPYLPYMEGKADSKFVANILQSPVLCFRLVGIGKIRCHFTYKVLHSTSIYSVVIPIRLKRASVYSSPSYSSLTTNLKYTVHPTYKLQYNSNIAIQQQHYNTITYKCVLIITFRYAIACERMVSLFPGPD